MGIDYDLTIYLLSSLIGVMVAFVIMMSFYYIAYWKLSKKPTLVAPHSDKLTKFAVLVAARNESNVISHLLTSLLQQTYPRSSYEVYVIVEDLNDPTVKITEKYGFKYFVRDRLTDDRKTKGYALQECIAHLNRNNLLYDAFMIFDADNIIDPNYLEAMNDLRQTGVKVGLGRRNFTNANVNWLTAGSSIMFSYMNQVTNKARTLLFHKATLMGTGYYVDRSIIDDIGYWIFTGMTEDIQFSSFCYLRDVYMRYYPLVSFYDEQSPSFHIVHLQHIRWLAGYFAKRKFLKSYGVQYDYHPKNFQSLMMFEYKYGLVPFIIFNVLMILGSFVALAFGILATIYKQPLRTCALLYFLAVLQFIIVYLSFVIPASITVKRDGKSMGLTRKKAIVGILTYMFFFYDFALAFIDSLFHPSKKRTWKRVDHSGEVTNKSIKE